MMIFKKKKGSLPALPGFDSLTHIIAPIQPYQREIAGGLLVLLALFTLLNLFSFTSGDLSNWWGTIHLQLFGWWAIPATLLVGGLGILLIMGRFNKALRMLPYDIIIGIELLFIVGISITHLVVSNDVDHALRLARSGGGGGFVGWGVISFFVDLIGLPLTSILFFVTGLAAVGLVSRMSTGDIAERAEQTSDWAYQQLEELDDPPSETQKEERTSTAKRSSQRKKPSLARKSQKSQVTSPRITATAAILPETRYPLPPLDLLTPSQKDPDQGANARYQAQIIEETLQGFGIPSEVVEINQGPTITQFGLKLGTIERKLPDGEVVQQRIRVNKVVALTNDLALALSAAPIRIEAPVPGRPLVGIEAPNSEKTMVSLRGVMEDKRFKGNGALRVGLGKDVSGMPVSASLSEMPHLLIAGATGSGKSVCLNTIICTLLLTHGPEQLRFLMIDPKMVELTSYNGVPHLIAPVVTDFEQVAGSLAWVTREMERRYKLFSSQGARSISSYNHKMGRKDGELLPYLVVVIDELADLMMIAPDEVERNISRIAQMARATGIHLVIATQRPSVDVVTGLIKANFPTRIAFAVSSQIDSRVILDTGGAEKLLGRGDMLYMASDAPQLARLQGCFVSDLEIRKIVNFWRSASSKEKDDGTRPWDDILAAADKDDLLDEAVRLVVTENYASTSMLQRRLGIGYPRASRLMDQLEEEGVVGPQDGSKPRDVLWEQDEEAEYPMNGK